MPRNMEKVKLVVFRKENLYGEFVGVNSRVRTTVLSQES